MPRAITRANLDLGGNVSSEEGYLVDYSGREWFVELLLPNGHRLWQEQLATDWEIISVDAGLRVIVQLHADEHTTSVVDSPSALHRWFKSQDLPMKRDIAESLYRRHTARTRATTLFLEAYPFQEMEMMDPQLQYPIFGRATPNEVSEYVTMVRYVLLAMLVHVWVGGLIWIVWRYQSARTNL